MLQIAALKKVSKGTRVLLLDRNGGGAKAIARELTRRGFRKVFVVQGGFSGWTSSKLQTKLSSTARPARCAVPQYRLYSSVHKSLVKIAELCQGGAQHTRHRAECLWKALQLTCLGTYNRYSWHASKE